MKLTQNQITSFQKEIYIYYDTNKRDLPWRNTTDPYHILVSEIMLQQTQVDRVIDKFNNFIKLFPTFKDLANASPKDVIIAWQGLGYNRRALNLKKAAEHVTKYYAGNLPTNIHTMQTLPGIGPYTAAAVAAFAFNKPYTVIETNIRTVFIHHFLSEHKDVHDKDLIPLIDQTVDKDNPRKWYNALMDYGTHLKATVGNLARKSKHYTKQSKFQGSDRQLRGHILKFITKTKRATEKRIVQDITNAKLKQNDPQKIKQILYQLQNENFIVKDKKSYTLKE